MDDIKLLGQCPTPGCLTSQLLAVLRVSYLCAHRQRRKKGGEYFP